MVDSPLGEGSPRVALLALLTFLLAFLAIQASLVVAPWLWTKRWWPLAFALLGLLVFEALGRLTRPSS